MRQRRGEDLTDAIVLELVETARHDGGSGVLERLVDDGWPARAVIARVEDLADRGLLDDGVSPWRARPHRPVVRPGPGEATAGP